VSRFAVDPRVQAVGGYPSVDGRSALVFVVPRSAPESDEVMTMVRELRADSWRTASDTGLAIQIGGFSASILDFDAELFGSLKRVIPVVLAITFIALVFGFRSRRSR
jgi:uncharacterized membrane protein YdfJ with MMPL/SSD domain